MKKRIKNLICMTKWPCPERKKRLPRVDFPSLFRMETADYKDVSRKVNSAQETSSENNMEQSF